MTEESAAAVTAVDHCHYPGCSRPRRPDPATGRPSRYCERADDGGGPVHNRANAWKARRANTPTADARPGAEQAADAPVSMARATLEQRLDELPQRVSEFRQYFDDLLAGIRAAGDVEAAGAEVEDAHRDALAKITEAERRASTAERSARAADERAAQARQEREEADALAEEALAEVERMRTTTEADMAELRSRTEAAVTAAEARLADARTRFGEQLAERDRHVEAAREAANAAHIEASAAQAALAAANDSAERERQTTAQLRGQLDHARTDSEEKQAALHSQIDTAREEARAATADAAALRVDLATAHARAESAQQSAEAERATVATLTAELERVRTDQRSERERLESAHAQQLALVQRNADERVQALNDALTHARQTAGTDRSDSPVPGEKATRKRPASKRSTTAEPPSR
ncbi:hypothetical protein ACNUDN_32025 (plasmid) [Mycobacterium sp. smrl_JER01]|uniref:hypothetical protein n=1 Tax=Mycobacterium sp. smrl_JER01 TaxID=3402633 RepID=UPI003ACF7281